MRYKIGNLFMETFDDDKWNLFFNQLVPNNESFIMKLFY